MSDVVETVCKADACLCQPLSSPAPHSTKLSMCSNNSSHVITPGVASGATKFGHCVHFGYAPTSLHMSSQIPANLFCTAARCSKSAPSQEVALNTTLFFCSCDARFTHFLFSSWPQSDKLNICSSNSSHVITPGVESGATKL